MLSYLAGFFDGEGCVGIYRHMCKGKPYFELNLKVTQKDRTILNFFQMHYGGYVMYNKEQDVHIWTTDVPSAVQFLTDVSPYLIVKASQAKLALEFQAAKSARHKGDRTKIVVALEEAQSIVMKQMKRVNGR